MLQLIRQRQGRSSRFSRGFGPVLTCPGTPGWGATRRGHGPASEGSFRVSLGTGAPDAAEKEENPPAPGLARPLERAPRPKSVAINKVGATEAHEQPQRGRLPGRGRSFQVG